MNDQRLSSMIVAGICMIVGGILGFVFFFVIGLVTGGGALVLACLSIISFVAGIILTGSAIFAGMAQNKKASTTTAITQIPNAKVRARYAINSIGETLFSADDVDWECPKTKLYVTIALPGGGKSEYQCEAPVWRNAGEGMTGTAYVQGNWLGQFVPAIGVQGTGQYAAPNANPYD